MARCSSAATTDESTPPDRPSRTSSSPTCVAHRGDGVVDDVATASTVAAAADLVAEALDDALALLGVRDLRMELHAVEAARLVGDAGQRGIVGLGDDTEKPGGRRLDPVAVAHPDIEQAVALRAGVVLDVAQQPRMAAGADLCIAVLALLAAATLPPSCAAMVCMP
jgi:hypothetical protein